jgi:hypothetical protein
MYRDCTHTRENHITHVPRQAYIHMYYRSIFPVFSNAGLSCLLVFKTRLSTDQNKAPMKKKHRSEESTDDRHGKDRAEQTKARVEQVRREVELLYKQVDQAPPDCSTPSSAKTLFLKASGYQKSSLSCCIQIKKKHR